MANCVHRLRAWKLENMTTRHTSILLAILKSLTNHFESRGAASLQESATMPLDATRHHNLGVADGAIEIA